MWSGWIRRGCALRITDTEGGANVGFLAYDAAEPLNRLNIPDTLKAQYTAKLTRGHVLMSDMGAALLSITGDDLGWHDPLGGHGDGALVAMKYGSATYQEKRNGWYRNAHDLFLIELAKHGLGPCDLAANINFFSKVTVDDAGRMSFVQGHSRAGATVTLRAEMDVLAVLNTCQHPMDPSPEYAPKPVLLEIVWQGFPGPDDPCRNFRAESGRSIVLAEQRCAGSRQ